MPTSNLVPVQMEDLNNVKDVSVGAHHAMVLKEDGTVWTWGTNWQGQLGIGAEPETSSSVPVQTLHLTDVTDISAKGWHSVAQKEDGTIWSWGYNEYGQIGNGGNANSSIPVQVSSMSKDILKCTAGGYHTIAIKGDGTVWSWGKNYDINGNICGALGNGTVVSSAVAVQTVSESGSDFFNIYEDGWFKDVSRTAWYYDAVVYMLENDIMVGTSSTEFSPGNQMERSMVGMVLYKLDGCPAVYTESAFTDIPQGAWYAEAVNWAYDCEVIADYGDGRFGPADDITREQFAMMMFSYATYNGLDVSGRADLAQYTDAVLISDWADEAMRWAVEVGLITGNSSTTLNPLGTATRAECATILMKWMMNFE